MESTALFSICMRYAPVYDSETRVGQEPHDQLQIVERLSVYDQWLDSEERSQRIFELHLSIAREHGFASPGAFVQQGCDRDRGLEVMGE